MPPRSSFPQPSAIIQLIINNSHIQMYKRKDNDIFGTANIGYAPRIDNPSVVDPHAAFRKKSEMNYQRYQASLTITPQTITARPLDSTRVNERAAFEEDYHKQRKEMDLQSSIFYPPTAKTHLKPIQHQDSENDPSLSNKQEVNYGRKDVFKREINQLPLNTAQMRGNSSRLFDLDERVKAKTEDTPLIPLIPHQMQWDQHDSIKYSHINYHHKEETHAQINNIQESKSTLFEQVQKEPPQIKPTDAKPTKSMEKKRPPQQKKEKQGNSSSGVQIRIMKGWQHKFMEGLSKHCKLNNSAILSFQIDSQSRVTLFIKRSARWENVGDFLRKDCKLKLRVMNP